MARLVLKVYFTNLANGIHAAYENDEGDWHANSACQSPSTDTRFSVCSGHVNHRVTRSWTR
ncbi:hypothetical protein GCM10025859_38410 [Alicyclobacillus fastidiosus]|nr:hypothetical protein GCM10025859_38410 [Alicyclobacillus fastidiosus]